MNASPLQPMASNRHLTIFAVACVIFALVGANAQFQNHGTAGSIGRQSPLPLYFGTIAAEWSLFYFVWRGVRAYGQDLFSLARGWRSPRAVTADVALGAVVGLGLTYSDAFVQHLLGRDAAAASLDPLLPRGPLEIVVWSAVCVTAGFVEELVFRGYLMRQLGSRLRSVPIAVIAQALWFATMHAYEGLHSVISIFFLGAALGLVALWRKQLRTNIIAHACIDLIEGIAPGLIRV